jgi:flagellar operon protein
MVRHITWPPPPQGAALKAAGPRHAAERPSQGASFQDALKKAASTPQEVRFSAHAAERLQTRRIDMTPEQREQLNSALDTAAAKGARESLVLMDDMALVVSVPNRTVITVARQADLVDKVFTGIDSAVVLAGTKTG